MIKTKNQKGFTLIEILVVVAIVGMLASFILTALGAARSKGRDAKRKGDMVQLQTALELYLNTYGSYPSTGGNWWGITVSGGSHDVTGSNGYIPNLAPEFINKLPVDPIVNASGYSGYVYRSDGQNYKLLSHEIGPESFPEVGEAFYDPARHHIAWMITNNTAATTSGCPGFTAVCW